MENKKNNIEEKLNEIDITPSVSIYNVFSSFDYSISTAISEFVDNSTQSFKDNKIDILDKYPRFVPKIYIIYYCDKKIIQIVDNCYGIKTDKISRVLKINTDPTKKLNSRNEFGMGLKTASFWFGKKVSILSKCLEENFSFELSLSLDNLKDKVSPNKKDTLFFKNQFGFDFGTCIQLSDLVKTTTDKKLIKLAKILSSKYTYDIEDDNLNIFIIKVENNNIMCTDGDEFKQISNFNEATKLSFFKEKYKIDEKTGKKIKIEIDDFLEFNGRKYNITGEIGILEKGSRGNAGLILFRKQRSIIGEEVGKRYKPYKIFKDGASFEYQRIYGIINLDDFPVTQQKNSFIWDNGLEDEFIDFLYKKITEGKINIIHKAKTIKYKNKSFDFEKIISNENANDIQESINQDNLNIKVAVVQEKNAFSFDFSDEHIFTDKFGKKVKLYLYLNDEINNNHWIEINKTKNENEYDIILNLNLPFFDPFNDDEQYVKNQMIKFCVYFAYAEIIHSGICSEFSDQRNIINKILKGEIKDAK